MMKHFFVAILLISVMLVSTPTLAQQQLTDEQRKEGVMHGMVTQTLVQCQAALSFLHDQFAYSYDVATILGKKPSQDTLAVGTKLKADFDRIEKEDLPRVRKYFIDMGLPVKVVQGNEIQTFVMWKNRHRNTMNALPRDKRGQYVQGILQYASACTENTSWLIDSFLE